MAATKPEIVLIGPLKPLVVRGLEAVCTVHKAAEAKDREAFFAAHADVRAIACSATTEQIPGAFMARFPKLQIVSSFGVGYDHVDVKYAAAHGIIVTNTPDVLTEEVADTALGLLLCTVREFPQAERYVRAGKWAQKGYPLSKATLRNRTVGIVGMGAIGQAIARRLDAFGVPVVYHTRRPRPELRLSALSEAHRHGARRRHADGHRAGRRGDREYDQCRGSGRAGAERHPDQHGARLGGGRAGFDPGAQG